MERASGLEHVSSGGVVYRFQGEQLQVALILVGPKQRWQLPKGTAKTGETQEQTALREVREETGLNAEIHQLLDAIEYWFYSKRDGRQVRYHKTVYFYLMRFLSGDVNDHDHEVEEARWIEVEQAIEWLAFESERRIVRLARDAIRQSGIEAGGSQA